MYKGRIGRKRKYEKDVFDTCKDQTKLFNRHVKSKLKIREKISRLKMDGITYEDPATIVEVMNNSFHRIFTRKEFAQPPDQERGRVMEEIQLMVWVKVMRGMGWVAMW